MIDASKSIVDDGVHLLSHTAEIVGAVMVIGGGVLVVIRSMLKGMDKRTKEHIDAATRPLIPNGGDSVGDLPAAVKQLKKQNEVEHGEIRANLGVVKLQNEADHALIKDQLDGHKAHTDSQIGDIHKTQQTLIEKLTFRHSSDPTEED